MKVLNVISVIMLLFSMVLLGACDQIGDDQGLTYTVSYDGNGHIGGSVPVDSIDYRQGETVTVLGNTDMLTNGALTFAGWNTSADDSGTSYSQGQSFAMGISDVTLYARWAENLYVSTNGGDANPGTQIEPKLTIQSAIDAAIPPTEIHVAAGIYEIADQVTMKNGVSILGGYSDDFSARDSLSYETIITDTRTPSLYTETIYAIYNQGITGAVKIDGFTINGGNAVSEARSICIYNSSSSLTISNNKINGGSGISVTGIHNQSSSPTISNNMINGGVVTLSSSSSGIENQSSSPTISNNIINGGQSENSRGIVSHSSPATIMNNVINGGGMAFAYSYGIYNFSSNTITVNNVIHGGIGARTFGIFTDRSSPDISNNTINGGSGSDYSIAVQTFSTYSSPPYSRPLIRNNVIFTEGSGTRWGIAEKDAVSDPVSVRNNTIFDCPDALYIDENSALITTVDQLITTGEGTQTLESWGNINEGNSGMFVDFAGGDWHLSNAAALNIRGGGMTVSGLSSDKDGVTRTSSMPTGMTNTGAAGWSMGAYEKD